MNLTMFSEAVVDNGDGSKLHGLKVEGIKGHR